MCMTAKDFPKPAGFDGFMKRVLAPAAEPTARQELADKITKEVADQKKNWKWKQ